MRKQVTKKSVKKTGLPPGSVVFTGSQKVETVLIHYLQYDMSSLAEKQLDNHADIIFDQSPDDKVDWYDLRGLHDTKLIELLGSTFRIHSLILEDIADPHQRPKYDEYDSGNFIVIKALEFDKENVEIKTEQIAIYFRTGLVFSFQETASDIFEAVRTRIHSGRGKIRSRGSDYLAYALVDSVVDQYFIVLEEVESAIEKLEEGLLNNPDNSIRGKIHQLKIELLTIRKSISPLREAISRFSKSDSPLIEEKTQLFIRDVYDHTIQIMDMVDTFRDMLNGLQDLYLSEISFKMNQVMQVLTIMSTIFIPLTFLAGIYGMNFDHIPELHWRYSYYVLWVVMLVVAGLLVYYFKKRKWL